MDKETAMVLASVILIIAAMIWGALMLSESACYAKTNEIGMAARWSLLADCQVNPDGIWIPLENYRKIQP